MRPCHHGAVEGFCERCDREHRWETHREALVLFGPSAVALIVVGWWLVRDLGRAFGWWH